VVRLKPLIDSNPILASSLPIALETIGDRITTVMSGLSVPQGGFDFSTCNGNLL
jgi:hypothetical protein